MQSTKGLTMTAVPAYDNFMKKVKSEVSAWLTLEGLADYVQQNEGAKLFLAVHGNHAFVKLDVTVSTFLLDKQGDVLNDVELSCSLSDGRYLTLNGSLFNPSGYEATIARQVNYSRAFSDQDRRDAYYEDMCYFFEIEEEKYLAARRKHEEQFLKWFFNRFNGGQA